MSALNVGFYCSKLLLFVIKFNYCLSKASMRKVNKVCMCACVRVCVCVCVCVCVGGVLSVYDCNLKPSFVNFIAVYHGRSTIFLLKKLIVGNDLKIILRNHQVELGKFNSLIGFRFSLPKRR